jgi:ketosteroid isomerase-like protein
MKRQTHREVGAQSMKSRPPRDGSAAHEGGSVSTVAQATLLAMTLAVATSATAAPDASGSIERSNERFAERAGTESLPAALREHYDTNAVIVFDGLVLDGLPAIEEAWRARLDAASLELRTERLSSCADMAIETGHFEIRRKATLKGRAVDRDTPGEYQATWKRVDGHWKVVMSAFRTEMRGEID